MKSKEKLKLIKALEIFPKRFRFKNNLKDIHTLKDLKFEKSGIIYAVYVCDYGYGDIENDHSIEDFPLLKDYIEVL